MVVEAKICDPDDRQAIDCIWNRNHFAPGFVTSEIGKALVSFYRDRAIIGRAEEFGLPERGQYN